MVYPAYCPVLLQSLLRQMVDTLVSRLLPVLLVSQSADPDVAYQAYTLHNKEKLATYLTSFTQLHCDTKYALKSFRALCVDLEAVYLYTVLDQN